MSSQKLREASESRDRTLPEVPREEWLERLQEDDFPEWANVRGTLPSRITSNMGSDEVVDRQVSEDDVVLDVGSSEGYTSLEVEEISGADVVGVDMPGAFSGGGVKGYGESSPEYVGGVAPSLPFEDGSVDGVTAFNSVTYLVRNIGAVAEEVNDVSDPDRSRRLRDMSETAMAEELLDDFDRATGEDGYVLLGEQTDESYLLLEKSDSDYTWEVKDYDSFPDHSGAALHTRYRPWVTSGEVTYDFE
jgi:hypothetical protein